LEFDEHRAKEIAREIVKIAVDNYRTGLLQEVISRKRPALSRIFT